MTYFIDLKKDVFTIINIPFDAPIVKLELAVGRKEGDLYLTDECYLILSSLFQEGTMFLWKSTDDLNCFINMAKRRIRYRIRKNSLVLPILAMLDNTENLQKKADALLALLASAGISQNCDISKALKSK